MKIPSKQPCGVSWIILEKHLVTVPKFTEGILVGGHILVMIFSGCGNIAALIIVTKSKAPKLSTKYFLIMLAVSDLIMTVFAPPTEIAKMMTDFSEWIFGDLMCKLVPFFQILSATMSATCLMAIAAERNFLIVRAMSTSTSLVNKLWQKWIVPLMGVTIILLPIGCALPQIWSFHLRSFLAIRDKGQPAQTPAPNVTDSTTLPSTPLPPPCDIRYRCFRNDFDHRNIIYWSVTGATYFLLLLCFLVSYVSIYKFVRKHGQFKKQLEEERHSSTTATGGQPAASQEGLYQRKNKFAAAERHRKTLKLILGLILLHLCCRAPNWIYLVMINVIEVANTEVTLTLLECFHFLSTVNCALNPFLYVIWNHSLRASETDSLPSQRKHSKFCKNVRNFCRSLCCTTGNENISGHMPGDPALQPTSSGWLWKTPTVYHVTNGANGDCKNTASRSARAYHSDKYASKIDG